MFILAWRNYPVTTPINVESNTTTLSRTKGILVVLVSATGEEKRQRSPFSSLLAACQACMSLGCFQTNTLTR